MLTKPTNQDLLSSDYKNVDRLDEDFDKRFNAYTEKIEYLSNEVFTLKNQNEELNRQITYLKQHLNNTDQKY